MKRLFALLYITTNMCTLSAQQTVFQYLSGTDKDHTVNWDFMVNHGRNSGKWGTIPVPSCWEMQGYGTYRYFEDIKEVNETGMYKHRFTVSSQHKGKNIFLVFEASMTETEVKVNGQSAGPVHIGGFYEFKYDITHLLQYGSSNLLEVTVSKKSTNNSVNRAERQADFWLFGGIFRPVYLAIFPASFIERVAIDARASGEFNMQVFHNAGANQTVEAQVYDLKGRPVEKAFQLQSGDSILRHHFTNMKLWNPEEPNLYQVVVSIKEKGKTVHTITQRFGFRTAELRPADGFYVNGKKVIFKGVCRHSQWPETGRTLSRNVHLLDIASMKGMNMNAVRMSHYPPDKEFLDLCDSLGLFVLDELTGWQKAYDTAMAKRLVRELVIRDVNHPSVVIWDNGNEGGWNRAIDNDFALYDPQKRHVIHPWERFNGTNTKHYPDFKYVQNEVTNPKEVFFPTEFMHGLYDGGHGAALEDFWNEMMKHPFFAGGFLWSLHDEGVVRADLNDSIDVHKNYAPDGILGPHREREGSYYTIRELWSPVYIETGGMSKDFNGTIPIENRYLFTNLDKIQFSWSLLRFPKPSDGTTASIVLQKGKLNGPSLAPGEKGNLAISFRPDARAEAFSLTATNEKGDTVCTWSWPMTTPVLQEEAMLLSAKKSPIKATEEDDVLTVSCDGIEYVFEKQTGYLQKVVRRKKQVSFGNGPALAGSTQVLEAFKSYRQGNDYVVEPSYKGDSLQLKWVFRSGSLPKLEYSYLTKDTVDFMGITFNYPEEGVRGMKYLGRGPYRVWKNRLKGGQLGVWQKGYNNTITGASWQYPEFKGWHSELRWAQVQTAEGNFVVYNNAPGIYLQMLQPQKPKEATNDHTSPAFPKGNIGFMHGINAIGTKFNPPATLGPQSRKNIRQGVMPLSGVLFFDFR